MERKLFSWEDWDEVGAVEQFFDCTLETNIGNFLAGEKIPTIVLDYYDGTLELLDLEGKIISIHDIRLVLE